MGCTREQGDKAGLCRLMSFPLCSSTFEYRRNFLLEVYSWFFSETERMWEFWCDRAALGLLQWESEAGESTQRVYSNLSPTAADVQLLFYVMLNTGGAPLRFSSYLRGLRNENCSEFCLFFWLQTTNEKIISYLWIFWSLPTLIEWFLEAGWVCDTLWWSLTDVWYQVVKHGSCTHIVYFSHLNGFINMQKSFPGEYHTILILLLLNDVQSLLKIPCSDEYSSWQTRAVRVNSFQSAN